MTIEGRITAEQEEKEPLYKLGVDRITAVVETSPVRKTRTYFHIHSEGGEPLDAGAMLYRMSRDKTSPYTIATEDYNDPQRVAQEEKFQKRMEAIKEVLMRPEAQEKVRAVFIKKEELSEARRIASAEIDRLEKAYEEQEKVISGRFDGEGRYIADDTLDGTEKKWSTEFFDEAMKLHELSRAIKRAGHEYDRREEEFYNWLDNVTELPESRELCELIDREVGSE